METIYIYGAHATEAAIREKPTSVVRVFLKEDTYEKIRALARERAIPVSPFEDSVLKKIGDDVVHQGAAAIINTEKLLISLSTFLETINTASNPALALLGGIEDPQNAGAIIRSAAALGISGILIPKDRQAQLSGAMVKTPAGAVFSVPLVAIGNVNQAIRELKEAGFWIYGLSGAGDKKIFQETFNVPAVFVVGNEARGIREKTVEHCDVVLSIPITAHTESLNASVAAGVAFYEWARGRNL